MNIFHFFRTPSSLELKHLNDAPDNITDHDYDHSNYAAVLRGEGILEDRDYFQASQKLKNNPKMDPYLTKCMKCRHLCSAPLNGASMVVSCVCGTCGGGGGVWWWWWWWWLCVSCVLVCVVSLWLLINMKHHHIFTHYCTLPLTATSP